MAIPHRKVAIVALALSLGIVAIIAGTAVGLTRKPLTVNAPTIVSLEISNLCDSDGASYKAALSFESTLPFGSVNVDPFTISIVDQEGAEIMASNVSAFVLQPGGSTVVTFDSAISVTNIALLQQHLQSLVQSKPTPLRVTASVKANWIGVSRSIDIDQSMDLAELLSGSSSGNSGNGGNGGDTDSSSSNGFVSIEPVSDNSVQAVFNLGSLKSKPYKIAVPSIAVSVIGPDGNMVASVQSTSTVLDSENTQLVIKSTLLQNVQADVGKALFTGQLPVRLVGSQAGPDSACQLAQSVVQNVTIFDDNVLAGPISFDVNDIFDDAALNFQIPLSYNGNFLVQLPALFWDMSVTGNPLGTVSLSSFTLTNEALKGQIAIHVDNKQNVYNYIVNPIGTSVDIVFRTSDQTIFITHFILFAADFEDLYNALIGNLGDTKYVHLDYAYVTSYDTPFDDMNRYCANIGFGFGLYFGYWRGPFLQAEGFDIQYLNAPLGNFLLEVSPYQSTIQTAACFEVMSMKLLDRLWSDFQNNLVPAGIVIQVNGTSVNVSDAVESFISTLGVFDWAKTGINGSTLLWSSIGTLDGAVFDYTLTNGQLTYAYADYKIQFTDNFVKTIGSLPYISNFRSIGPAQVVSYASSDGQYWLNAFVEADYFAPRFHFHFDTNIVYNSSQTDTSAPNKPTVPAVVDTPNDNQPLPKKISISV